MFDCHIHTDFSPDGRMTPVEACEAALAAGLEGVAFTDHLDIDYPDAEEESFLFDFEKYINCMKALKAQKKGELKISVGIEAGIQPHVIGPTLDIVRSWDFDYVLASVHIIDGLDPYIKGYYDGKTQSASYERYLQELLFMVRNFPDFDNVAHPEYITRYACYDDRSLRYNNHTELFDELLREIIKRGKGLEVNTGSFRDKPGVKTCEYDAGVLKRYRELGGEIVSLSSDAHDTRYIGYKFDFFREVLLEAGFGHAAYFMDRKPVFYRL